MKTTDGYNLNRNDYYVSENGESVILRDWMEVNGKLKFFVSFFYEGEAMQMVCYGDMPIEKTIPYEVEGEPIIISSLFKNCPTIKLDESYKTKLSLIEGLSSTIHLLKEKSDDGVKSSAQLNSAVESTGIKLTAIRAELLEKEEESRALGEAILKQRAALSELEDSVNDIQPIAKSSELKRLRKNDYMLTCLEHAGVGNWEGRDFAIDEFRKRYPVD